MDYDFWHDSMASYIVRSHRPDRFKKKRALDGHLMAQKAAP